MTVHYDLYKCLDKESNTIQTINAVDLEICLEMF